MFCYILRQAFMISSRARRSVKKIFVIVLLSRAFRFHKVYYDLYRLTKLYRLLTILPIDNRNKFVVDYYALNDDRIKNAFAIIVHNDGNVI